MSALFKYFVKRLLMMIPMMLLISILVFFALELAPIDPLSYLVSPDMAMDAANVEALRESLGLNDPGYVRYFRWLGKTLRGDLGYSIVSGAPISRIVALKLPATFELALLALLLSSILGIALGMISAIRQNGMVDYISRFLGVVGVSLPQFFVAIVVVQIFAVKLRWLPTGGREVYGAASLLDRLPNLVLPLLTMILSMTAVLVRYTRNTMLDVMRKDYVKTARSTGIPEWQVYVKHVFRNAMGPVLVIICFRLPMLISGSVVIESVFAWPGIGSEILAGVSTGDYPVVMMSTLMTSAVILFASFLVDLLTALLDPRVRFDP